MSGSGWVDLVMVLLLLAAVYSGYRQGAVASLLAFVGVILGASAGMLLAPHLIEDLTDPQTRLILGLGLLALLVVIGEVAGIVLGRAARQGMRTKHLRAADSAVGSILQGIAVLVAAWLFAIPLSASDRPHISAAVRGSTVLGAVDDLAPAVLRDLPSDLNRLLNSSGLPDVLGPFGSTPIHGVDPPNPDLLGLPSLTAVQQSVLRIDGTARSCNRSLEGTGFVVGPQRVMTNAHVVAGTDEVAVVLGEVSYAAQVVLDDPLTDIAVLYVPGLDAPVLPLHTDHVESGSDAVALGYPGGGPMTWSALRVREAIDLRSQGIYGQGESVRNVYTVRGSIKPGNSGGPMVNPDGAVIGMVFGAAVDDADTGFALTAAEIADEASAAATLTEPVATGGCIG